ncbi:MAG: GNAT family N-acetyltransferase [Fusobacteriaceae bacterium]
MMIRDLTLADEKYRKEIKTLIEIAYRESFHNLENINEISEKKTDEFFNYIKVGKARCLIAVENELIGMCWYFFKDEDEKKICHINQLAVLENFQGRGIATQFLDCLEKICLDNGVDELQLNVGAENIRGIKFYEKKNFIKKGGSRYGYIFQKRVRKDI